MNDNRKGALFVYKYRKLFIAALVIGGVLGGVLSFFIPKKYMSTAIVYPYNAQNSDQLISNPQFGYEIETEQLLQLLGSKSMRDKTVEKFKLYDYYDLDTTNKSWDSELTLRYVKDVNFLRSKYLSVVINVTMKDPELAAKIANFQVEEINRYRKSIFEENRKNYFEHAKEQFEKTRKEVNDLRDTIYKLKGGTESLLFNFVENLNNEHFDPSEFITSPELEKAIVDYRFAYDRYITHRSEFEKVQEDYNKPMPGIYSIDKAQPSYKKVSPSTSINIILGALVLFVLVFTIRFALDKWQQIKSTVSES